MNKTKLALALTAFASLLAGGVAFTQSSFPVQLGFLRGPKQPIAFSHEVHAGKLGMNCVYCHYGFEKSPIANIPAVSVCMGCHKIAMSDRPEVQKLAGYYDRGEQVPWVEVYKLPAHVKFNHERHVKAGVQCLECHGPVPQMPVMYQWSSLKMGWCVTCHRQKLDDPKYPASMDCLVCHH
uniref:Cytochrome c7-like domain-containing protein n=1 Tax=Eiseniibacteriota bacterium TaxID=2212470 RepID=A0A832MMQ0_UNCEI